MQVLADLQPWHVLPCSLADVEDCVLSFSHLQETPVLLRNLPNLLLASMQCLEAAFRHLRATVDATGMLRGDRASDGGRMQEMERLQNQAKALVMFAGMIPFRLPGVTSAELIRLQVAMSA